jgi:hypothetical protein
LEVFVVFANTVVIGWIATRKMIALRAEAFIVFPCLFLGVKI